MSFHPGGPITSNFGFGRLGTEMMHHIVRLCSIFVLLANVMPIWGCHVIRVTLNAPLNEDDVAFIVPGRTTFAEVTGKLGSPDSFGELSNGIVATYRFLDVKYSRINFGWAFKLWSPVDPDLVISRTGLGTDALEVFYDSNWVATGHGFLRHVSEPKFNPYPF